MLRRDVLRYGASAALTAAAAGTAAAGSEGQDEQDGYEPLGSVELQGSREAAVGDDGETVYVAVANGIATVDVSDPTEPEILAERRGLLADREGGPLQLLRDVWPDGDRLLAVGPAQGVPGDSIQAALLFDVSDPADPQLLDVFETEYPIHNAFYEDGVAYLTGNGAEEVELDDGSTTVRNQMVTLSTEGDAFEEVGRWSINAYDEAWDEVSPALRQLHDLYVQDGTAYLAQWDAGTWIVDVSDPSAPEHVAHFGEYEPADLTDFEGFGEVSTELFALPGNSHYVQVDETGDLLGVGREAWAVETDDGVRGGPGGIDLFDVSDPANPEHLSSIEAPETHDATQEGEFTTAHNFDVVDGRLYSSWYYGGVKLHDVSDPANPEELAWWRQPEEAFFWTAQSAVQGEFFVGSSAEEVLGYGHGFTGGIYVFPDEAGQQADAPDLTVPPEQRQGVGDDTDDGTNETDDSTETGGDGNETDGNESDTNESDGDGMDDGTEQGNDTASATDDGESESGDDGSPGFGALAAAGGLGVAAWRLRARDGGGE